MPITLKRNLSFKTPRLLTQEEIDDHLDQKVRLEVTQDYMASLIKANSTYLESLDLFHHDKGRLAAFTGIMVLACLGYSLKLALHGPMTQSRLLFILALLLVAAVCLLLGKAEFFAHTHLPVRLNRKTRMVHVYRSNGTVLTVPWDEVYFTIGRTRSGDMQDTFILGHQLAPDGRTILYSFALGGYLGDGTLDIQSLWEFFRRYMEEGLPQALEGSPHVVCFPMDRGREPLAAGWTSLKFGITGPYPDNTLLVHVFLPLVLTALCFRWVIMRINKRPVWPHEIEAACAIAPEDPYVYDVTTNPPYMRCGY